MSETAQSSGWTGWAVFAGVVLIILGVIDAIMGLIAILMPSSSYFVVTDGAVFLFDVAGWGWWHLIIGILLALVGFAVLSGAKWARVIAVILVALNAISQIALLGVQPWWSLIMITLDVVVIYALTVHGKELSRS